MLAEAQELAAKINAANAARREGLPVHKEYGDGFRWVELNKPGSFAAESEAMGHSVKGYEPPKGHADWVEDSGEHGYASYGHGGWDAIKSGKAKVHSLVDAKGHPHVTVESHMPDVAGAVRRLSDDKRSELAKYVADNHFGGKFPRNGSKNDGKFWELLDQAYLDQYGQPKLSITQIKGKQNARPVDDYQSYVADFVRTGDFHPVVGDAHHTDMIEIGGKLIRKSELQGIADQVGFDLGYAEGLGGRNYFNDMSRKDPNILSESDKTMLDAIRDFTPPEMKDGGSVDLRSHYLGTPMTEVSTESMSPDLLDILEEWGAEQDLKTQTREQIENLSPVDLETLRLALRLDKHDRYKTGKFPSGQDSVINPTRFHDQPIEDMPGDFKFNHAETDIGNQIRDNPYKPNEMDSMTKDWDGMSTQRQEKIKQRYYADGGTVNLRAHYLGN